MKARRTPHAIRVGGRSVRVPGRKWQRRTLGFALVAGGIAGFLPVVGFWMIPLGLAVLAIDWPLARRWERQLKVKSTRLYRRVAGAVLPGGGGRK